MEICYLLYINFPANSIPYKLFNYWKSRFASFFPIFNGPKTHFDRIHIIITTLPILALSVLMCTLEKKLEQFIENVF